MKLPGFLFSCHKFMRLIIQLKSAKMGTGCFLYMKNSFRCLLILCGIKLKCTYRMEPVDLSSGL